MVKRIQAVGREVPPRQWYKRSPKSVRHLARNDHPGPRWVLKEMRQQFGRNDIRFIPA